MVPCTKTYFSSNISLIIRHNSLIIRHKSVHKSKISPLPEILWVRISLFRSGYNPLLMVDSGCRTGAGGEGCWTDIPMENGRGQGGRGQLRVLCWRALGSPREAENLSLADKTREGRCMQGQRAEEEASWRVPRINKTRPTTSPRPAQEASLQSGNYVLVFSLPSHGFAKSEFVLLDLFLSRILAFFVYLPNIWYLTISQPYH